MRVNCLGVFTWLGLAWLTVGQEILANEHQHGTRYAILVGVNNYQVESSGYHPLKYARADVERLSKSLLIAGYTQENIRVLVDESGPMAPTKANIYRQLKSLTSDPKVKAEDSLLVVFAGHGFSDGGRSYLAPADVRATARTASSVPVSELAAFLAESKIGEKYVIIDACRNEKENNPDQKFDLLAELKEMQLQEGEKQGIVFLAGCLGGQQSIEDSELEQGVFMHYVCKAIEGEADFYIRDTRGNLQHKGNRDDQVSIFELIEYAASCTRDFVQRKYDVKQSPWSDIHSTGNLTIASITEERRAQLEAVHGAVVFQTAEQLQQLLHVRQAEDLMSEAMIYLLDGNRQQTLEQVSRVLDFYADHYLARRLRSLLYLLEGNKPDNKPKAHEYYQKAIADMRHVDAQLRLLVPTKVNAPNSAVLVRAGERTVFKVMPGDVLQIDDMKQHNNQYWLRVSALQRKTDDGSIALELERPETDSRYAWVELSNFVDEAANEAQVDLFFSSQRAAGVPPTRNGTANNGTGRRLGSTLAQNLASGNTPRLEAGIDAYNTAAGIVNSVSNARLPTLPNPQDFIRSQTFGRIPFGLGGLLR